MSWNTSVVAFDALFAVLIVAPTLLLALRAGLRRIRRGLTGTSPATVLLPRSASDRSSLNAHGAATSLWRLGLALYGLAVPGVVVYAFMARASADASRVQHGRAAAFAVFGFDITSWGAEHATLIWASNKFPSRLRPLAGCLTYLGQSNGTVFLYQATTHEVLRVPTKFAVVITRPPVCESCRR